MRECDVPDCAQCEARSATEVAIERALDRATRPVADDGDGWETTAAVLAFGVMRLRGRLS